MSDTAVGWTVLFIWLALGFGTVHVGAHRHRDWYRTDAGEPQPGYAAFAAVAWPVTILVTLGAEMFPEAEK